MRILSPRHHPPPLSLVRCDRVKLTKEVLRKDYISCSFCSSVYPLPTNNIKLTLWLSISERKSRNAFTHGRSPRADIIRLSQNRGSQLIVIKPPRYHHRWNLECLSPLEVNVNLSRGKSFNFGRCKYSRPKTIREPSLRETRWWLVHEEHQQWIILSIECAALIIPPIVWIPIKWADDSCTGTCDSYFCSSSSLSVRINSSDGIHILHPICNEITKLISIPFFPFPVKLPSSFAAIRP